jgi:hypothetical protein
MDPDELWVLKRGEREGGLPDHSVGVFVRMVGVGVVASVWGVGDVSDMSVLEDGRAGQVLVAGEDFRAAAESGWIG